MVGIVNPLLSVNGMSVNLFVAWSYPPFCANSNCCPANLPEMKVIYVVPPLEGFWWQDDVDGIDYSNKDAFNWISVIRLPDFITKKDFDWAVETATKKKKLDCSSAEFITIEEGLCVQIMHFGAFDDEPATVEMMDTYLQENGYKNDLSKDRLHHEIYLSDARKVAPEKWKTVIRHPIKRM